MPSRKQATSPSVGTILRCLLSVALTTSVIIILFRHLSSSGDGSNIKQQQTIRRLESEEIIPGPILNEEVIQSQQNTELTQEEIQEKHIKQYLGGLYPKVDRQFHPLYLRDKLRPREIDPKWGEVVDGDIPFFW